MLRLTWLCVAWVYLLWPAVAARAAAPPGFLHEVLGNGLRVSILPDPHSPVVATEIYYHVGAAHEPAAQVGLAHLFEHLVFRSVSTSGDPALFERFVHTHGGYANAYTAPDETVYISEIAPEWHDRLLEMEAARMTGLRITQQDLDRERRIVSEEGRMRYESNAMGRLLVRAVQRALGAHPYTHVGTGDESTLATVSLPQVERFFRDYYRPNNAHVIIVGPVDGPATLAKVRARFGPIPGGGQTPSAVPPLSGWSYPPRLQLSQGLLPAKLAALIFPLPPPGGPDDEALLVLRQLLSQGKSEPVAAELVRRRRKAVAAGAMLETLRAGGGLGFYAGYLPYRRETTALSLLRETVVRLGQGEWLTEAALRSAKRALRRDELRRAYSASAQADSIGQALWHEGDVRRAFDRAERLEAVSLSQVRAALQRYVVSARPLEIYVTPEQVPVWLTLFGWLYPLVMR